jgi:acyl-CoA reductase-like NAD-dependent aldehyde dehydrogenase
VASGGPGRPNPAAAPVRRGVDGDVEHLAALEVANSGHTIGNARWEAGNVRDVLHDYAAAPGRLFGRQIPVPGGIDVTFREPIGVVGVIVPWNFPAADRLVGFRPRPGGRQHGAGEKRPR